MLFIVMKSSLPAYNIVGGRGFAILMMSLGIVPNIPCRRIFVLSDPGVPSTFVVDCSRGNAIFRQRDIFGQKFTSRAGEPLLM